MKKETQNFLLKLARQTLRYYFTINRILEVDVPNDVLREKRGTFVTLTKSGLLRGCIGHTEPMQEIYKDVIDNTLAAAFQDFRFPPLREEEVENIEIEISVLTNPKPLMYSSVDDLLDKLQPLRDGLIIEEGIYGATYLPQVWEDLPDKVEFLSSLCLKAGLLANEWRKGQLKVFTYQAEVFNEINSK